jgi:hypothetical protein
MTAIMCPLLTVVMYPLLTVVISYFSLVHSFIRVLLLVYKYCGHKVQEIPYG